MDGSEGFVVGIGIEGNGKPCGLPRVSPIFCLGGTDGVTTPNIEGDAAGDELDACKAADDLASDAVLPV